MATLLRPTTSALLSTIFKFGSLNISRNVFRLPCEVKSSLCNSFRGRISQTTASFHTSLSLRGLDEFFDDEKKWGEKFVKVGRSWKKEELRIKSNEDLHKLWFVLLKEKNMLLTMEHEHDRKEIDFPNPERIDKVEDSMENLERVVRERNRAYWLLETGETGERPCGMVTDPLGRRYVMQYSEHFVPIHMNYRTRMKNINRGLAATKFKRLMKEKAFVEKKKYYNRVRNHVCHLVRRFPHMSEEAVAKNFPEVSYSAIRKLKRSRGHHLYNES